MKCSFSIENNDIESGQGMNLIVEGIDNPDGIVGKKCIVKIYEIDTLIGKRQESTKDDLLAVFDTEIIKGLREDNYYFDLNKTIRTDTYNNKLPIREDITDPMGNVLPVQLDYTPPHFIFYFDQGSPRPSDGFTIMIQSDANELEMYIYEIGFTIEIDGNIIYDARKIPAYVNCTKVLAVNCHNSADFIKQCHERLINDRGFGTHFGNKYIYEAYTTEREFLEAVSIEEFGFVDNAWIRNNTGVYWDVNEKNNFTTNKQNYKLQKTSCIDYVRASFELGFKKTGMNSEWKAIWNKVKNGRGDLLASALVKNGWVALYYNPDVVHPNDDGPPGSEDYKAASEHTYSYGNAKSKKVYYGIPVHDFVTNYFPTVISTSGGFRTVSSFSRKPSTTTVKQDPPEKFFKIPVGLIIARGGMHTAIFSNGNVLEVHWDVGPFLSSGHPLFEKRDFCSVWPWNSGVIVVPSIYWA